MPVTVKDSAPTSKQPCIRCGRLVAHTICGRPWTHKCPHGTKCEGMRLLGLPGVPKCRQCNSVGDSNRSK